MAGAISSAYKLVYSKAIIHYVDYLPEVHGSNLDTLYASSTIIHGKTYFDDITLKILVCVKSKIHQFIT